jgi:hypothetical protein
MVQEEEAMLFPLTRGESPPENPLRSGEKEIEDEDFRYTGINVL